MGFSNMLLRPILSPVVGPLAGLAADEIAPYVDRAVDKVRGIKYEEPVAPAAGEHSKEFRKILIGAALLAVVVYLRSRRAETAGR